MRRSTLIVCIIIVVALSAGIALLLLFPEHTPEPEQPAPPVADTAELINETADDVTDIYFIPADGDPYTLIRNPISEEVELIAESAIFPGTQTLLSRAYSNAIWLQNLTVVTSEADDSQLELFGFDAPVMTWHVNRTDGTSVEITVGAQPPAGQGRYVRRADSREVLLLTSMQSSVLTMELEDIYDLSFFPPEISPFEEEALLLIEKILIETDSDTIEIHRRSEEELMEATLGGSAYHLLQPFIAEANDFMVQNIILHNAIHIMPVSIESTDMTNLAAFGLDDPARLTITTDEWTGTLLIGDRDAERDGRYVIIEGYDAVLLDPNGNYSFLNADPSQFRSQLIWLHNINTVSSVLFELDGDTRFLEFEHDHEEESLEALLDGEEISETNARRLYVGALMINHSGSTDASIPGTAPVYRVTINFLEGDSEIIELYRLNDSEFLIAVNGESTGFFITRMAFQQNLLRRFDLLDAGEDIPM
jgi:hypothetical protein